MKELNQLIVQIHDQTGIKKQTEVTQGLLSYKQILLH